MAGIVTAVARPLPGNTVVVDGVIYIESALGNVIAVDGRTGVTKWKWTTPHGVVTRRGHVGTVWPC